MLSTIAIFEKIYPKHILLEFELPRSLTSQTVSSLNQVQLNHLCANIIKQWTIESIDPLAKFAFPCWLYGNENLASISKITNGFVLEMASIRIVFIPSDAIDIAGFEIPQEWIDLPNWKGNYYVPVRVDIEHQFLHLWGFISYGDVQNKAEFDRIFRNYHIAQIDTIPDLAILQEECQSSLIQTHHSSVANTHSISQLSPVDAADLIQQLQQRKSRFSPRLDLPFSQWGAILDREVLLASYLNPETDLNRWYSNAKLAICDGWESLNNFLNPPQAIPALHQFKKLPTLDRLQGISIASDLEIKAVITELYHHQVDLPLPAEISGVEDLVPLLKHCQTPKIWWKAAEYLWAIQPDHPLLITRIRQLETQFLGRSIALTISMIPTLDEHIAVLVRLYPAELGTHLPPGLKLTIQDNDGANLLTNPQGDPQVVISREDNYIQLYFVADAGDRFVSCIILDNVTATKSFKLPTLHSS